jgi:hypothetical protein
MAALRLRDWANRHVTSRFAKGWVDLVITGKLEVSISPLSRDLQSYNPTFFDRIRESLFQENRA